MPTRPVTWDLDVPPETLLDPPKPLPPRGEVPPIDKFRAMVMGTRFELLKVSTFAAFLLGFVGVAVHGSHLTNPDNAFAANTSAAFQGLAATVSTQTVYLRGKTEALALAATHKAEAVLNRTDGIAPAPVVTAQAELPMHGKHASRLNHNTNVAQSEIAGATPQTIHRAHSRHASIEVAVADLPNAQWSGSLRDLPSFFTAEGSRAGQKLLDVVQGSAQTSQAPHPRHRAAHIMNSAASKHLVAPTIVSTARESSSMLDGLVSPDSLLAGMGALLLYTIFVVILLQMKGGLRAYTESQSQVAA